jgi:hypothetical protein
MTKFFHDLFSSDYFMPHGHCYAWTPSILWASVISDVTIAISYFSIPVALLYEQGRIKHVGPFPELEESPT